jgi:hypothetical protein
VQEVQHHDQFSSVEAGMRLRQRPLAFQEREEFAARHELQNCVQIEIVVEDGRPARKRATFVG